MNTGLDYFREFGPSYAKLTRTSFDFDRDYVARYESATELPALAQDATRFDAVART